MQKVHSEEEIMAMSKWGKIKVLCSPKHIFLMAWYGKMWWKPKHIWLVVIALLGNFRIAKAILRGRL